MAGKIFTSAEADSLYGKVIESVIMNLNDFKLLLDSTDKNIMFKVKNGNLTILGDARKTLYPKSAVVDKGDVFANADKPIVLALLGMDKAVQVAIENRSGNTTITYGNYTLEDMALCPPICI